MQDCRISRYVWLCGNILLNRVERKEKVLHDKWLYQHPEMVSAGVWPILASLWIFLERRCLPSTTPLRASDGALANNSSLAAWSDKTNCFINLYQWDFASQTLGSLFFTLSGKSPCWLTSTCNFISNLKKEAFCLDSQVGWCFVKVHVRPLFNIIKCFTRIIHNSSFVLNIIESSLSCNIMALT